MKQLWSYLTSRTCWIQVGLALLAVVVLLFLTQWLLSVYTTSGKVIQVPEAVGSLVEEVAPALANSDLHVVVMDSVYKSGVRPGEIVDQTPAAGKKVKKGRKIYVTINAWSREQTTMPLLTDKSYQFAPSLLANAGLELGRVERRPSPYKNLVLSQSIGGRPVLAGVKLPKGTVVDIAIGIGNEGGVALVPSVLGLIVEEAEDSLLRRSLQLGMVSYDATVQTGADTVRAVVYKQLPAPDPYNPVDAWTPVNLWLTLDADSHGNDAQAEEEDTW